MRDRFVVDGLVAVVEQDADLFRGGVEGGFVHLLAGAAPGCAKPDDEGNLV